MARLRLIVTQYGPIFSHGLIAGVLAVLTLHSGFISG